MFGFYITLIIIFSIFLIILTLLQNSKRDNSSGNVIGSMGVNQIVGIKETTDILTRLTLFFIFAIFVLSIFSYKSIKKNENLEESPNLDITKERSNNESQVNINDKEAKDERSKDISKLEGNLKVPEKNKTK